MYGVDPHLITGQIHRGFHLCVSGYKIFQYMSVPLKTERLSDLTELEWWTETRGSVEEVMSHSAQCSQEVWWDALSNVFIHRPSVSSSHGPGAVCPSVEITMTYLLG